uniref:CARD domain-containing protein n=1 Tax=Sander lucioperca TaxID=283035 RepID=A0A8C9XIW6_SANLU
DKLLLVRSQFIIRVSDPVLNQLLDNLLEHRVITDEEMQSVRTRGRADKARDLMDSVRRKGRAASSVLISALCELDPPNQEPLKFKPHYVQEVIYSCCYQHRKLLFIH